MIRLTVTAQGQVRLPRNVLQHLGIKPGDKIELDLLLNGRVSLQARVLQADRRTGTIDELIGCLAGETTKTATLDELNEAAAQGRAGQR